MSTGDWGRPAKGRRRRGAGVLLDGDSGYSGPPPAPPLIIARRSPWAWLRRRPGGVLLEVLLAAAVLASVALLFATGVSGSATGVTDPTQSWATKARPVLSALVDDLTAVDAVANSQGTANQSVIASAGRSLSYDVSSAHALGKPRSNLADRWDAVLAQIDKVRAALTAVPTEPAELQTAGLSSQTEIAVDLLARFVSAAERHAS